MGDRTLLMRFIMLLLSLAALDARARPAGAHRAHLRCRRRLSEVVRAAAAAVRESARLPAGGCARAAAAAEQGALPSGRCIEGAVLGSDARAAAASEGHSHVSMSRAASVRACASHSGSSACAPLSVLVRPLTTGGTGKFVSENGTANSQVRLIRVGASACMRRRSYTRADRPLTRSLSVPSLLDSRVYRCITDSRDHSADAQSRITCRLRHHTATISMSTLNDRERRHRICFAAVLSARRSLASAAPRDSAFCSARRSLLTIHRSICIAYTIIQYLLSCGAACHGPAIEICHEFNSTLDA
jgi:hypothetical protein